MKDEGEEQQESEDDNAALEDIRDDVGPQSAEAGVDDGDGGGEEDGESDVDIGGGGEDLSEGADLGGGPEEGSDGEEGGGDFFDAWGVALAEPVTEGGDLVFPEREGEGGAVEDDAESVAEGFGGAAGEAIFIEAGGGADTGFGAEPGGEDAEADEDGPEAASGEEVIVFVADLA